VRRVQWGERRGGVEQYRQHVAASRQVERDLSAEQFEPRLLQQRLDRGPTVRPLVPSWRAIPATKACSRRI